MSAATTSSASVRAILGQCQRLGIDVDALLKLVALDHFAVNDPDCRIPSDKTALLWKEAFLRTGDSAFALHAAEQLVWGEFGLEDFIAANAPTVGEGLARLSHYFHILGEGAVLDIHTGTTTSTIRLILPKHPEHPLFHIAEFALCCIVTRFRILVPDRFELREVHFTHPTPAQPEPRRWSATGVRREL
jgi:hypothetical protein